MKFANHTKLKSIFYTNCALPNGHLRCGLELAFCSAINSTLHHDFLILRESYFLGSTRVSNERPYKQNVAFSAEKLGWRYLISRGSTFPSADETFPYRVMSHPRFKTVAKLSWTKQPRVMLVRTPLGWTFYSFFHESFGFLKGIFQNPLKRSAR